MRQRLISLSLSARRIYLLRHVLRHVGLAALAALAGCDIDEITIVEIEDVVIAEIYVNLAEDPTENEIRAYLHHTVGALEGVDELPNALVVVRRSDGLTLDLTVDVLEACLDSLPTVGSGVCFLANPAQTPSLSPGDLL